MNFLKKIGSVVLLAALLFMLLVGCAAPDSSAEPPIEAARPIVVMGAMECETSTIADALTDSETTVRGNYEFTTGTLDGYPVVCVRCLVGMVNAATAATLAIDEYHPLCVILQGTAGGHDPARHQGDIILGENLVDIAAYRSPHLDAGEGSDFTVWSYPGHEMRINGEVKDVAVLHSDESLLQLAEAVDYAGGALVRGTVGSGDVWNREMDKISFSHEVLGSDCEEMEGFAVAMVCTQLEVPFLAIRIISNSEIYPEETFTAQCGVDCQNYALDVMRSIIAAQ